MEEPPFIKCEPPSLSDTEEYSNIELKVEPDDAFSPSGEECADIIKEEHEVQDSIDEPELDDTGAGDKPPGKIDPLLLDTIAGPQKITHCDFQTKAVNNENPEETNSCESHGTPEKPETDGETWDCFPSGKTFDTVTLLQEHVSQHWSESRSLLYEQSKQSSESKGSKESACQKSYVCRKCDKTFPDSKELLRHECSNSRRRRYICEVCGIIFPNRVDLRMHFSTHSGIKPFQCRMCDRYFPDRSLLMKHVLIHSGHKSHTCSKCGKIYYQREELRIHMFEHTDKKPYSCRVCGKLFAHRGSLSRHFMVHAEDLFHKCEYCGKEFKLRAYLRKHLLLHTRP